MFLGREGIYWWIGVVEDNDDPFLTGRVKVRIFGYHSSFAESAKGIPTADLPWATILVAPNAPGLYGKIGLGEWVLGFFLDGPDAQEPIVMGLIPTQLSEGAVTPNDSFGKYGVTARTFDHITVESSPQNYVDLSKRVALKSPEGHTFQLIDVDSTVLLRHKNTISQIEMKDDFITITNQGKTFLRMDLEHVSVQGAHGSATLTPQPPPVDSGGGGGKIICTKLYELGYLSQEIYELDQEFGKFLVEKSPDTYYGYIAWAQTVVDWMEGNGPQCMFWIRDSDKRKQAQVYLSTKWAKEIATPWASHMAYLMGNENEKNVTGKVLMAVGKPICKAIGTWQRWFGKSDQPTKLFKGFLLWGIFAILRFIIWFYRGVK